MIIAKQNMYPVVVVTTRDVIAADGGWLCAGRHVRVARFDRMLRGSHDDFRARYRRQTGLYEREK
jgi:hypothetical protein